MIERKFPLYFLSFLPAPLLDDGNCSRNFLRSKSTKRVSDDANRSARILVASLTRIYSQKMWLMRSMWSINGNFPRTQKSVFLNEENLEEIEAKNEVKSRLLWERKRPTKALERDLARVLCACIYIYKYSFNFFSTRFSLSFFPSLSLSLSCE